ncbi:hypothetical protein ACJRO7_000843 [Eucalyptus globulus]|uniref:Wound-induced protein 1 n=1 Tax=Eucalyptus globulus TaxID=34317 RepID=A0ABD3LS78_EUCGL
MATNDIEPTMPESDTNKATLLVSDLEWWFHGPPHCQHMMRVLTGQSDYSEFTFHPRSTTAMGDDCVIAEVWEGAQACWVHVWTLKNGLVAQFREYIRHVADRERGVIAEAGGGAGEPYAVAEPAKDCFDRSLPGLLLAIRGG